MIKQDYDLIVKEYFDIQDRDTRKIMISVNEADQNMILNSLASKLYDNIINRIDDIDFGNIPKTKGDITKLENYEQINQCIDILSSLLKEYKQDTTPIDIIADALKNIEDRKNLFEKAFRMNVELPMIVYCTVTLSIISSISFLISTSVEFIKEPNTDGFDIVLDKVSMTKTKQNLLFKNLDKFNGSCKSNQLDHSLDYIIKKNIKNLTGAGIGTLIALTSALALILNIIPLLRELVFFFFYSRTKVADYFEVQSNLLKINAYNLQNSGLSKTQSKETSAKQLKIADTMQKIANKISITSKKAEKEATKEISNSKKQYKAKEIVSSVPDSASSAIF